MKVLILSHSSEMGGAERSMFDLFDYWAKQGKVELHFIIRKPYGNMLPELKKRGWDYTSLFYTNWSQRTPSKRAEDIFRNAAFNSQAIFDIEKVIAQQKPDVVMTNTIVSPWAAIAAYYQRVPHVWFVREYGDIDHNHVFELGREKMMEDIDVLSDLVVTNSKTLAKFVSQYINHEKVTTLYTPFDLPALKRKAEQKVKNPFKFNDSLKLVITGKVAASKGQAEAAEAVGKLAEQGYSAELCVIGLPVEPEDAEPLNAVIRKYGIQDRVHLIGQQSNPLAILSHADVGIMASKQEAFGRVTFEYMSTGRAVVGANSGATPEMIEHGKNGFLYDQGKVSSLTTQLLRYAKNPQLVKEHGEAARKKAERMMKGQFDANNLFARVETVVKNGNRKPRPLNFSHRWLEYPGIAQKYLEEAHALALYKFLYYRGRYYAKVTYLGLSKILPLPVPKRFKRK